MRGSVPAVSGLWGCAARLWCAPAGRRERASERARGLAGVVVGASRVAIARGPHGDGGGRGVRAGIARAGGVLRGSGPAGKAGAGQGRGRVKGAALVGAEAFAGEWAVRPERRGFWWRELVGAGNWAGVECWNGGNWRGRGGAELRMRW